MMVGKLREGGCRVVQEEEGEEAMEGEERMMEMMLGEGAEEDGAGEVAEGGVEGMPVDIMEAGWGEIVEVVGIAVVEEAEAEVGAKLIPKWTKCELRRMGGCTLRKCEH